MSRSAWRAAALAVLVLLAGSPAAHADPPAPIDGRFTDEQVIGGLDAPTTMRIAPDGDIYVAEKAGLVIRYDAPEFTTSEVVVDLRQEVADFVDRGLLGLELDPSFGINRRIYLLYTYDGAPEDTAPRGTDCADQSPDCIVSGKLVRVTLPPLGKAQSRDIAPLIEHQWCQQFTSHSIGTVLYGPDGALYVGGGEGANFDQVDYGQFGAPPNPCGDPPGGKGTANSIPTAEGGSLRSQDVRTSGDPTGLDGTIIRVDPDTGAPLGAGPFTLDTNAKRIVAYGFRNPFRFTFRPGTRELWVGDVGQIKSEEIDVIPDAAGGQGLNFGWPCIEANDPSPDWAQLNLCKPSDLAAMTAPYYTYRHSRHVVADDNCPLNSGSALSGVAFQTPAAGWPPEFDGGLFFSDFARGCIWFMPKGSNGLPDPARIKLFARGSPGAGAIDLRIGPHGSLYFVYWNPAVTGGSSIRRFSFTGHAPHAALTADPSEGAAPLDVHLDASGSTDPDAGQTLHYAWDLDGDGTFTDGPDAPQLDHRFSDVRDVPVSVRVTDPDGLTSTATVTVHAGNTPPQPTIDTPPAGTHYSVGDTITFHGSADDEQEGSLDASRLRWTAQIAHCPAGDCHFHLLDTVDGSDGGSFVAIDHELPSFIELTLTATDSRGLQGSVTRRIDPIVDTIRVATEPAGIPVRVLGHAAQPSPQVASVIDGAQASVAVPATAVVGGITRTFLRWSDGSTERERIIGVHGDTVRTAIYSTPAPPPEPPIEHEPPVVVTPPAPALSASLAARRRLHLARRLHVRLACTVRCTASTSAVLRGLPRRLWRVPVSTRHVRAGHAVTLTLKLSRAQVAAVRGARHAVTLQLVTSATAADGRRTHARATIRIVR